MEGNSKKTWFAQKYSNVDYNVNFEEIQELENRLNILEERINVDKAANFLKTTILNDEKITPHFLRLAKTLHTDSLEKICNEKGAGYPLSVIL